MDNVLTYDRLLQAIKDDVGIELTVPLQPAGGNGKVFPPTYNLKGHGPEYAKEQRLVNGELVEVVLMDSVASQANRLEMALKESIDQEEIQLPLLEVELPGYGKLTSLEAPHRVMDAWFINSTINGVPFIQSDIGQAIMQASSRNATAMYHYAPTSLVFGAWNSHAGAKSRWTRLVASEIYAWGPPLAYGTKPGSRLDPMNLSNKLPLYQDPDSLWATLEPPTAKDKPKPKKPSELGLGSVTPSLDRETGGVSVAVIEQRAVVALLPLRSLHFPDDQGQVMDERDTAGRAVLAALAILALALQIDNGYDLRSGTLLQLRNDPQWRLLRRQAQNDTPLAAFDKTHARNLFNEAIKQAELHDLRFATQIPPLTLSDKVNDMIVQTKALRAVSGESNDEADE